jgi:hypothetical protein
MISVSSCDPHGIRDLRVYLWPLWAHVASFSVCCLHEHMWPLWLYVTSMSVCGLREYLWPLWASVTSMSICCLREHLWPLWAYVGSVSFYDLHELLWPPCVYVTSKSVCGLREYLWPQWAYEASVSFYDLNIWNSTFTVLWSSGGTSKKFAHLPRPGATISEDKTHMINRPGFQFRPHFLPYLTCLPLFVRRLCPKGVVRGNILLWCRGLLWKFI